MRRVVVLLAILLWFVFLFAWNIAFADGLDKTLSWESAAEAGGRILSLPQVLLSIVVVLAALRYLRVQPGHHWSD